MELLGVELIGGEKLIEKDGVGEGELEEEQVEPLLLSPKFSTENPLADPDPNPFGE